MVSYHIVWDTYPISHMAKWAVGVCAVRKFGFFLSATTPTKKPQNINWSLKLWQEIVVLLGRTQTLILFLILEILGALVQCWWPAGELQPIISLNKLRIFQIPFSPSYSTWDEIRLLSDQLPKFPVSYLKVCVGGLVGRGRVGSKQYLVTPNSC